MAPTYIFPIYTWLASTRWITDLVISIESTL